MPLDRLCAQKLKHKGYSFICDCTEHMGSKGRSHLMNYMPRKAANGRIEVTSVMKGSRVFLWFQPLLAERNSFSPAPPLKAGFLCKNRIVSISSWGEPCPMASHSHAQPKATKGYIFPACLLGKGGALFLVACLCSQSLLLGRAPEIWKETDHDQCLCKPGWLMHRPKGWLNNPFPQKCISPWAWETKAFREHVWQMSSLKDEVGVVNLQLSIILVEKNRWKCSSSFSRLLLRTRQQITY